MSNRSTATIFLIQQVFLGIAAVFWLNKICTVVPHPYLDEVFHIRQAQAYLKEQWYIWDPKITTPPGLYLVSYVQKPLLGALGVRDPGSPLVLRSANAIFGGVLLPVLVRELQFLITDSLRTTEKQGGTSSSYPTKNERLGHTALNICLFPPLFFFYGLYYTDVLSAVSVLYAYRCNLRKEYVKVIFAGLSSLLFRQTNVFWVAIFLGGLELVRTLPRGRPNVELPRRVTYHDVILGSWKHVCVYDPPVSEAYIEDYIKTIISLATAALANLFSNPVMMFWSLSSYILVLLAFAEFLVWNGGVVLGDKENHVASIHLAQMLYIWPYFFFFSFPLLAPYLLNAILPQQRLPSILQTGSLKSSLPRIIITIPTLAAMLAIIHYNTIVHPFTLADNRHYMFYVFRILLRHPLIKYLAAPIYFISAWTCLLALGVPATTKITSQKTPSTKVFQPTQAPATATANNNRASFLLIWLISTALSLCSAPLVEPRYLIIPWLIWRLHLTPLMAPVLKHPPRNTPAAAAAAAQSHNAPGAQKEPQRQGKNTGIKSNEDPGVGSGFELWLWLETTWFLLINFATGYVFLYWGFEWPQEPGRVQRFMW